MKRSNEVLAANGRAKAFDSMSQEEKGSRRRPAVPSNGKSPKKKSAYSESTVLADLGKKSCNRVGHEGIDISRARGLGNSSFGKLDFLQNHCGYAVIGRTEYFNSLKPKEA